jgi:hypothetical protein
MNSSPVFQSSFGGKSQFDRLRAGFFGFEREIAGSARRWFKKATFGTVPKHLCTDETSDDVDLPKPAIRILCPTIVLLSNAITHIHDADGFV